MVSFTAAGRTYALPLERVAEVLALPADVTPVPRAGQSAIGVVALRGGVLPLLSLPALLGLPAPAPDADARIVVARIGGTEIGLIVDALGPILRLAPEDVDPVPTALNRSGTTAVDAICRVDAAGTLVSVLSADRLLEGTTVTASPVRSQDAKTPDLQTGGATLQVVVFDVAGESYGVPVGSVREVLRVPETMTRLPKSPDLVVGAIDVRGTVLAVVDQRRRFGLPPGEAGPRRRIVVLESGGGIAGLLVDGVSRMLRLELDTRPAEPGFLRGRRERGRPCRDPPRRQPPAHPGRVGPPRRNGKQRARGGEAVARARSRVGPRGMIRLLVVDDSALMRKLLGNVFAQEGDFEVAFARDGEQALAEHARFRPDVITLDVNMPGLDGLACLDRIMLDRPTPVVMVSSLTADGAEVTLDAMERGAVDFVAKPGGAVSLEMDRLGPLIVQKVRAAARARLRPTLRLAERIRARSGTPPRPPARYEPLLSRHFVERAGRTHGGTVRRHRARRDLDGRAASARRLAFAAARRFPWPVVVAQHMPGSFTGPLARRLDGLCALRVQEASKPVPLAPGNVYIGRGDADVTLARRPAGLVVQPVPAHAEYLWHPSVDRLVASAMELVEPARLVGILMTGMGRDGASAMTELRTKGGRTIAESEETAVVWGMPGELVKAGGATVVAPLEEITAALLDMVP